jgi:hypothetical protein
MSDDGAGVDGVRPSAVEMRVDALFAQASGEQVSYLRPDPTRVRICSLHPPVDPSAGGVICACEIERFLEEVYEGHHKKYHQPLNLHRWQEAFIDQTLYGTGYVQVQHGRR